MGVRRERPPHTREPGSASAETRPAAPLLMLPALRGGARAPALRRARLAATAASCSSPWDGVHLARQAQSSRLPRLYVPGLAGLAPGACVTLDEDEARHAKSLRLAPGSPVELCDLRGTLAIACLTSGGLGRGAAASASLTGAPRLAPRSGVPWTLAVAGASGGLAGGRGDWLVEKAGELGAAVLVPLATARAKGRAGGRDGRWGRLAISAAKQSLNPHAVTVEEPADLAAALACAAAAPLALVAAAGAPPVSAVLASHAHTLAAAASSSTPCWLFVGPEGDFDDDELAALASAGALPVGLGTARLRVETAALALLAAATQAGEGGDG